MEVITSVAEMQKRSSKLKEQQMQVGFVPTMGYFHQGHLSLMDYSVRESDVTVVSVFVNPIQFGPLEDYEIYPRDLQRDKQLAREQGVDILFLPNERDMYPEDFRTQVAVSQITELLCGASRPGHFDGVTTVVTKLFNIIKPDVAYFGRKDYQQLLVIKQIVRDLNLPVEIAACPIARDQDGLAISSRNVNLSLEERDAALVLYQSLQMAREQIESGERNPKQIEHMIKNIIDREPLTRIDYVKVVDGDNLTDIDQIQGRILLALAVNIGETRLIDNDLVEVD